MFLFIAKDKFGWNIVLVRLTNFWGKRYSVIYNLYPLFEWQPWKLFAGNIVLQQAEEYSCVKIISGAYRTECFYGRSIDVAMPGTAEDVYTICPVGVDKVGCVEWDAISVEFFGIGFVQ